MQNEMRDKHLVTDNPQGMVESMLNFAYAKNEKVYLSYANGTEDIELCEYVSQLTKKNGCNLSANDVMEGSCIEGCDCEVAILYSLAVQAAELRERLKHYESLEKRGLLQTLPCKVGDTVYFSIDEPRCSAEIDGIYIDEQGVHFDWVQYDVGVDVTELWDEGEFDFEEIGKTVFLTTDEAEKALKVGVNNA